MGSGLPGDVIRKVRKSSARATRICAVAQRRAARPYLSFELSWKWL